MKKNIFLVAMLGMVLAFGFVLAGCATDGGKPYDGPKSFKITGITHTNTNGEAEVFILNEPVWEGNNFIARTVYHSGHIIDGKLSVDLNVGDDYDASDVPWTGSGEYYILLMIAGTDGFGDEGGENYNYWWAKDGEFAKYNIQNALTTLEFSQFKQ